VCEAGSVPNGRALRRVDGVECWGVLLGSLCRRHGHPSPVEPEGILTVIMTQSASWKNACARIFCVHDKELFDDNVSKTV
jgi:hypothetical protein